MIFKREHNTRGWSGHTPTELKIQCRFCGRSQNRNCVQADGKDRQRAHQRRREDAKRLDEFSNTMTKSSEGTMTAKEKYLAVHPDARAVEITPRRWLIAHGDDPEHPGYAILGIPFVSEKAAWQNAAESLPVEAKEKCGATFEANMPWRICNLLKGHDSMHHHDGIYWVFDAREPRLEAARQLLPYIYPNADEESKEILARMLSENVEGMGMIPLFYRAMDMQMELNRPKPHPDSSSIPDGTADYLLGRCIPHLDTLAHHGNQEAKRLRAEIIDYAKGSR